LPGDLTMTDLPGDLTMTDLPSNLKITDNEREHYVKATRNNACKFPTPDAESIWAMEQMKDCSKCLIKKDLLSYMGNTSGRDAFDADGYRLRRPECRDCTKSAAVGKAEAVKVAKSLGIPHKAPEGTACELCKSTKKIVFDHDHEKNTFRGWLCDPCNRSMGVLGDKASSLLEAVAYLSKGNEEAQLLVNILKKIV
jgi:hypothetical protein